MMIIKRASLNDKTGLARILASDNFVHHHLDWRSPYEWLGSQPFWMIEETDGELSAGLACTQEVPPAAWVRLFTASQGITPGIAWKILFEKVLADFRVYPDIQIVSLVTKDWFEQILRESGFRIIQHIVILEWNHGIPKPPNVVTGVNLRLMNERDLHHVLTLDHLAFNSIWKLSRKTLQLAFNQSSYATVVEYEKRVVGYQISSATPSSAHLSRLAVLPDLRRQKIAYMLVSNLLEHYRLAGISSVTVNTQTDNHASLALYAKLGFTNTGESYPVYLLAPGGQKQPPAG